MVTTQRQLEHASTSDTNVLTASSRLTQRLEGLDITLVSITPSGRSSVVNPHRWIDQAIVGSPPFSQAVKQRLPALQGESNQAVQIWPGVWLAPIRVERDRRTGQASDSAPVLAGLLVGESFLESEQFALICDIQKLDRGASLSRIDRQALFAEREAVRLAKVLHWLEDDTTEIARRDVELRTLSQQLGDSYDELSLLYKLSAHMTVNHSPAQFLSDACQELQQVVGLRWLALQLTDDEPRLEGLEGQVFVAGETGSDLNLIKRFGHILMLQNLAADQPLVVEDTSDLGIPHLSQLANRLLVISLRRGDTPFGILFGGDKLNGTAISSADSKLCNTLSNSLTIFLQNTMLYEDVQAMFMGTLHALTNSIDAKDSYTYGHSERVALVAKELGIAAGLDQVEADRLYLSGLVHDVGKIGVPEAVLCKAGPLTDQEFDMVKRHPEIGAHILANIRQMQDLIPGVLYHHEHWDGRGYPHRLSGEDIPLYGRMICLADSFDAMSSNRSYRASMPHDEVLDEIKRCAGTQFDPELAKLFINLDFDPFFALIAQHIQKDADITADD